MFAVLWLPLTTTNAKPETRKRRRRKDKKRKEKKKAKEVPKMAQEKRRNGTAKNETTRLVTKIGVETLKALRAGCFLSPCWLTSGHVVVAPQLRMHLVPDVPGVGINDEAEEFVGAFIC